MGELARIVITPEPVYQVDRSPQASALYARVSAISGFTSTETPHRGSASATTEPQPRTQSTHSDRTLTATPASRQPWSSHDAQDRM